MSLLLEEVNLLLRPAVPIDGDQLWVTFLEGRKRLCRVKVEVPSVRQQ